MKQVQPSLLSHIQERLSVYEAQFQMASQWVDLHLSHCLNTVEGVSKLNIEKFDLAFGAQSHAAFQMLMTQWHESHAVYIQVLKIWNSIPGKQVAGMHAQFIKDRNEICRVPHSHQSDIGFIKAGDTEVVWNHSRFVISTFPYHAGYVPPDDAHILTMDASKLKWPIKLRIRQTGDTMKPLGMKGNKKVSDILADIKMAVDKKSRAYVMESSDSIIYVQDFRISSQVRLSSQTRQIVQIQIHPLKA
jgi:tRNA(Ile)-lysidine synthase